MTPFFMSSFLVYLKIEKRYSIHTIVAYEKDVEQFLDFSGISNLKELTDVTSLLVRGWIVSLFDGEFSNRTINRKLSSLRTYFKWLLREGKVESNPLLKVRGPKSDKKLPSFARVSEMKESKLDELYLLNFEGKRDRLIIELFYQTGMRLSELINLKNTDVEVDRLKVLGKRSKERIIPISKALSLMIESFKNEKLIYNLTNEYLIVLKTDKKIYSKLVYRIINTYLGLVTDLDRCSPHVLRHTFATHLLNNGAGLETLKDLLGHSSLSSTQVYTHNSFEQIKSIYSQAHPRGGNK